MYKCLVFCIAISAASAGNILGGLGLGGGFNGGLGGLGLAGGYDGGLAVGGGYGKGIGLAGGYAGGLDIAGGYGKGIGLAAPIAHGPIAVPAAIHSRRDYKIIPVASNYEAPVPAVIEIDTPVQPVHFIYRSISSPVTVEQFHAPAGGSHQATRSEDAPHVLSHENVKTVVQELREVIQPFRRVVQEVLPVQEEIKTLVSKGEGYDRAALSLAAPVAPLGLYDKGAGLAYDAPLLNKGNFLAGKAY